MYFNSELLHKVVCTFSPTCHYFVTLSVPKLIWIRDGLGSSHFPGSTLNSWMSNLQMGHSLAYFRWRLSQGTAVSRDPWQVHTWTPAMGSLAVVYSAHIQRALSRRKSVSFTWGVCVCACACVCVCVFSLVSFNKLFEMRTEREFFSKIFSFGASCMFWDEAHHPLSWRNCRALYHY
jgi:hypothetical protein